MHKKFWILLLSALLLFSLFLLLPALFPSNDIIAYIYQDGNLIKCIDLTSVSSPYTIPITNGNEENIILIEPGAISVSSANCPDQTCVHQGKISSGVVPIVCLPHKIVIEIKEKNSDSNIISR